MGDKPIKLQAEFIAEQVGIYTSRSADYQEFRRSLEAVLTAALRELGIPALVQARVKEVASFSEKYLRKREQYPLPAEMFTDLCGARVIVESKNQIAPLCDFIHKHFEIGEAEDLSERLRSQEFGYQSLHFIVSFKSGVTYPGIDPLPEGAPLLQRRLASEATPSKLPLGPIFKAEIQVRTLLQHAWAVLIHDNLYKTALKKKPRSLEREAGKIASLLEDADDSFLRLLDKVDAYRSCYGAYLTDNEIKSEISILDIVRRYDPTNEGLAHRLAQLATTVADWDKAIAALTPFSSSAKATLRRDLGWAYFQAGEREKGYGHLQEAVILDPQDASCQCTLGDFYRETQMGPEALNAYEMAFQAEPTDPRALGSYIKLEIIENKNLSFLPFLHHNLEMAIDLSREWARYGMHLPWALYDIGFFSLLLGRPDDSLAAYAKAAELSTSASRYDAEIEDLEKMYRVIAGPHVAPPELANHLNWARGCLLLAAAGKFVIRESPSAGDGERLKHYLKSLNIGTNCQGAMATATNNADAPLFDKEKPIVIVAGGCDTRFQMKIEEYRTLLNMAFEGFEGTIISGGTTAGIPGIVGDLPNAAGMIRKVAYLPTHLPGTDRRHEGYQIFRTTTGQTYSPLDVIYVWRDLLAVGVPPHRIKVLGVNGGRIAAIEYRLALVMGAEVGILRESGREASRMAQDPDWMEHDMLFPLPDDAETLRSFIQPPSCLAWIDKDSKEMLARQTHASYRKEREKSVRQPDQALLDWEKLPKLFQKSCLSQIDHVEEKIRRLGLALRRVEGRDVKRYVFSNAQVEILAEIEHGRWNMERFREGQRLGVKNQENTRNPYLVAWRELTDEIKGYDREPVNNITSNLALRGYEIYDPNQEN